MDFDRPGSPPPARAPRQANDQRYARLNLILMPGAARGTFVCSRVAIPGQPPPALHGDVAELVDDDGARWARTRVDLSEMPGADVEAAYHHLGAALALERDPGAQADAIRRAIVHGMAALSRLGGA